MSLQEKEAYDLAKCKLAEYLQDSAVCSMDEYVQHGTTSTLQHCLSVVHISCAMAEKLHIRVNYENLIVGALLHDFYLYDWHTHQDEACCTALPIRTLPAEMQRCGFTSTQRYSTSSPPICGR